MAPGGAPAPDRHLGGVARNCALTRRGLAEDSRESGPGVVSQDRNQSGPLGGGVLREKVQLRRLDWIVPEGAPVAAALLDRGRQCCIVCVDRPVDGTHDREERAVFGVG